MRIIAGRWKGHRLTSPSGRHVRPTRDRVKEAWMSMLGGSLEGARVLDLFAGTGSLGLECLSRGAELVVFVERSGRALTGLRENLEKLGVSEKEYRIERKDVLDYVEGLPRGPGPFHLALADPPYGSGLAGRLLERFVDSPFSDALWIEHSTREDLSGYGSPESRRYGDTTLSWIRAPGPDRETEDTPRQDMP